MALTLGAALCGADNRAESAAFGPAKAKGRRRFLRRSNGMPAHDTRSRVFRRLAPEPFQAGFPAWARSASRLTLGEGVAIDGKTLRGRGDRAAGRRPLRQVSAWARANRLTLGQVRTTAPSNAITAILQLRQLPDLRGGLAAIDARGGPQAIARQSVAGETDYPLAVKGNQGQLCANWPDAFPCAATGAPCREVGKGPGRLETRPCRVSADRADRAYSDPWGE